MVTRVAGFCFLVITLHAETISTKFQTIAAASGTGSGYVYFLAEDGTLYGQSADDGVTTSKRLFQFSRVGGLFTDLVAPLREGQ